ncbi:MAG TPA: hypothetical protein VII76_06785 [Acidimicrobiales bacterium]
MTPDNVADLDEWQVVEGGSTNNSAAYNPFNARQVTDSNGAPLAAVMSSDGFPAFTTWASGCAATVAALLQPSMAPIVSALLAGDVSVPAVFLFDVDQSPWCAPSEGGIPCYANQILAGEIVEALLKGRAGQLHGPLTSYSNTGADLRSYQADASVTALDQERLASKNAQLALSDRNVFVAKSALSRATRALRRLALEDYTSGAASRFESSVPMLGAPDQRDSIGQYYLDIAAARLTEPYDFAQKAVRIAVSKRRGAQASVTQITSLMDAADATEKQALAGLEVDAQSIEAGLACTAPPVTTASASPVGTQGSAGQLWQALQGCLAPSPS